MRTDRGDLPVKSPSSTSPGPPKNTDAFPALASAASHQPQRNRKGEKNWNPVRSLCQCLPLLIKGEVAVRAPHASQVSLSTPVARRAVRGGQRARTATVPYGRERGRRKREEERAGCEMAATGLGVKAAPFTYAAHALAAAAAVLVLVWCVHFRGGLALEAQNKNLIFNVHPVLMLIGYIILGSEAIMIYKVFPKLNHDTAKLTHLILHAIATVLGAFGIYCAFKFHNDSGIANLYSLHSWLGIGTISLYGIQWVFGFVTFFFPGAAPSVRRSALPWHALFGLFVYVLALATAELGFLEKLTFLESGGLDKYGAEAFLVNFTALVVVLFGASVVVAAVAPVHDEAPQGYESIPVS